MGLAAVGILEFWTFAHLLDPRSPALFTAADSFCFYATRWVPFIVGVERMEAECKKAAELFKVPC